MDEESWKRHITEHSTAACSQYNTKPIFRYGHRRVTIELPDTPIAMPVDKLSTPTNPEVANRTKFLFGAPAVTDTETRHAFNFEFLKAPKPRHRALRAADVAVERIATSVDRLLAASEMGTSISGRVPMTAPMQMATEPPEVRPKKLSQLAVWIVLGALCIGIGLFIGTSR